MEKRRKDEGVLPWAAETFDLPADIVAGLPRIEILGSGELFMERHRGILSYDNREIDISGGNMTVRIKGENLELRAMNGYELRITGNISGVEFEY
ncbi:YabP/YqfC family sporulation protein [Papillibacter cinnamivorans]|uniref:Sporulation protein YqfC n=1 Tax=Papillibacter cinnamivorans DSM 12816 TaxID=1122930 RepID=A0A1W1Z038_9FIRM|nr:YabP/YqfC family sporulation protein [Papillibacter cinnamivorans]SMC41746.1 sporulation protein YqfC [Papillibacter cinnamivorans DSM 12816]